MAVEIVNPVPVEVAEPWLRQLVTALLGNPYDADFARRVRRWQRSWRPERTWGVRDGDRWVGTLATDPRTLTVPGHGTETRDVEVDALTAVSVAATHRRRGLLTDMLGRSLAAAKDRGDPIGILIAAEWPIYGRFGYAPASSLANYHYDPRRSGLVVDGDRSRIRQVEPDELAAVADAIFEAARRRRPGQVDRHAPWWDRELGTDGYERLSTGDAHWFLHDGSPQDGVAAPDGLLGWKAHENADLNKPGMIEVIHLACATDRAEHDFWTYLSGLDLVGDIELWGPVDEPARCALRDGRALRQTDLVDLLWLRLLDVPAALGARAYALDGDVVLDVRDPTPGGYAQARVRLTVSDGSVSCAPSDREPDVRLDQRTLASMYLGGFRLRALATVQGVEELTPRTLDRLDLMFSTPLAPYTQTGF